MNTKLTSQSKSKPLTKRERAEMHRLGRKWATGKATAKQMERFRSLERRA